MIYKNDTKILRFFQFFAILSLFLGIFVPCGMAEQNVVRPEPEPSTGYERKNTASGTEFMAVTSHPLATKAAYDILDRGGSAADAGIAAQLVLGLVEPQSSGIGGGAFALYYDVKNNQLHSYDARETAPENITPGMFLNDDGTPMEFYEAAIGGRAVGVPGVPRLMETLYENFGQTEWPLLFSDAIYLAETGFTVTPRLHQVIAKEQGRLNRYDTSRNLFYDQTGKPVATGSKLKNENYANTLKTLSQKGIQSFYNDEFGIVETVQSHGGFLEKSDLQNYKTVKRIPVCSTYRGHKICGMGEPSSGGLTVLQILNLLERFNLSDIKPFGAEAINVIAEASRLAFADRNQYMADPAFVMTPGIALLDRDYIDQRSNQINPGKVMQTVLPGIPARYAPDNEIKQPGTTHISIIDKQGNILSMTSSIEKSFGSDLVTPGGFLLNSQLTDFSFLPERDGKIIGNAPEGGKRPRSSMSPTIIFDPEGNPYLIVGSAGGSRIIGFVLQRIIALIDWGMDLQAALDAPNILTRTDRNIIETEQIDQQARQKLEHIGYALKIDEMNSGLTAIQVKNGVYYGAADPRREGLPMGR